MTQTVPDDTLDALARGDAPVIETVLAMNLDALERSGLDPDTYLLVRLAVLVAVGAPPASYAVTLGMAQDSGVTVEQAQAVLVAIAPLVGTPRITAAAGNILRAVLGAEALADAIPEQRTS
ncbi:carboxymuconolactone decarboxylase family protein [Geodermatophilus sp. SYSU D01036]